ncbi:hypothetical protein DUNSADRAFT_380 [Dunaliella salina]|uniref:Uncharacterized protein n=1 Tax=Dunaliella salina TaxID=3046 RepID=A0ABQ7GYC0_DUNSA|nr:hypothetical protein DUNSADRAFT_380 [Dunaliella salina]|eukprot:KAF5839601.1 hypothetical protein DUNSADRAFT_380 [Dunaliella salina]
MRLSGSSNYNAHSCSSSEHKQCTRLPTRSSTPLRCSLTTGVSCLASRPGLPHPAQAIPAPILLKGNRSPVSSSASSTQAPPAPTRRAAPLQPPYNVLVTGSTKGVGRALAEEFLLQGDKVIITSRSDERVQQTVAELAQQFGADRVKGRACNVGIPSDVVALADWAKSEFGTIDIW